MASGSVEPQDTLVHLLPVAPEVSVALDRILCIELIPRVVIVVLPAVVELSLLSVVADVVLRVTVRVGPVRGGAVLVGACLPVH